ncbi:hypothetical protein PENTCL1PPCAC_20513, partial [Pristionchus entomophagus]
GEKGTKSQFKRPGSAQLRRMIVLSLLLLFFSVSVESRVSFTTSEVLDDIDLKGTKAEAAFKCYTGCRVYSPTRNANIVILDNTGKEGKSLLDIANVKFGDAIELPENNAPYKLKNKGPDSPSFVFYAVEKGAMNYQTKVLYVTSADNFTILPKTNTILTVLSSSGAVRFSDFSGDHTGALPTVHATGFDSISSPSCRPVYDAVSTTTLLNTAFPVYSPITTINFKRTSAGKSVVISGETYVQTSAGQDASAVYVSPGYIGCENVGDSLYTSLSLITSFDSSFTVKDSNGLSVAVNGDYSIADKADAITLTVNDDVQTLFGKKPISKAYDATSFKIGVKWAKKEGSKDRFAMQIDVMSSKDNLQTTTKSGNPMIIGSSLLVMFCSALMR